MLTMGADIKEKDRKQNTEATAETMAEENVMKRNTEATNSQAAAITSGFVQDLIAAVASVFCSCSKELCLSTPPVISPSEVPFPSLQ